MDPDTGRPIVDVILDEAQQKGTGKWMSQNAFDVGAPIPTVNAAVEARLISALKTERVAASRVLAGSARPVHRQPPRRSSSRRARRCTRARSRSYAQGMALLRAASAEYHYDIQPGDVAKIWRAGCIIRAALLGDIRDAFRRDTALVNLMTDAAFSDALGQRQQGWRAALQTAIGLGIPMPAMSASLAYYDAYRSRAPARQRHAGPARLLRRTHLSPRRS